MGAVISDPHIWGFEGDIFDFMGEAGKVYNMLSARSLQVNVRMGTDSPQNGLTFICEVGVKVGNMDTGITRIHFKVERDALGFPLAYIDGKRIGQRPYFFPMGLIAPNGEKLTGSVFLQGNWLDFETGAYRLGFLRADPIIELKVPHIDICYETQNLGVLYDGVPPHGVVGQTADLDGKGRFGRGKQGEGAIEGVYTDYEVSDLWADDFKFNRFGTEPTVTPTLGACAKKKSLSVL